jgi:pyridoxamine 5'-phosphate oxidase
MTGPTPQSSSGGPDLAAVRASLEAAHWHAADLDPDPFAQFEAWLALAREVGVAEPDAMVLSTVDAQGRPSSRHVLQRGFDGRSFCFYTNYRSQKAGEIEAHPVVALCFPWIAIGRQVRAVGRVERTSAAESDTYFTTRPRQSQLAAWASEQSSVLADRAELEARYSEMEARFEGRPVDRPPHWGGYRVVPDELEFWQSRPNRLHDRFRYRSGDGGWIIERLAP